jgi:peroxiredoxin
MMKYLFPIAAAIMLAGCGSETPALAAPPIGSQAPDFQLPDANGKAVTLGQFKGKVVVLEWNNPGCPYVKKHYGSGNMQKTQAAARKDGVVWLSINSGGPGNQGHMNGAEAKSFVSAQKAQPTAYLLDPQGTVGKRYGAVTTPHMYVIDKAGKLAYVGGIDDRPTADQEDIAGARNHVLAALAEMKAGKTVSVATSRPYGCSVKYAGS